MMNPRNLVFGAIVVSLLFVMTGNIYKNSFQDILTKPLLHINAFDLDWWSVSHFMLYSFFGFVMPGYPLSFFTMGVLFEIFEDALSNDDSTKLVNCNNGKNNLIHKLMCNGSTDSYWYSNVSDIAINLFGYVVGQAIRTTFAN